MSAPETDIYSYEKELAAGVFPFCGVDEAGRGPLAGDVYAAAVILPKECFLPGLNDSKKLSAARRDALYESITSSAVAWAVASASVEEIEELNIKNAAYLAMDRAIAALQVTPQLALVDGNDKNNLSVPAIKVIKGDGLCASIAAASILAKVSRDRYMLRMAEVYPGYGFEKHKGYGTAEHYAAIRTLGPCAIHRPTFLRKMH